MPSKIAARSPRHKAFGKAVRELRARHGLSQEEFGARIDIHRNYVGAVERGEHNPTLQIVFKLADGLGIPASELHALAERRHAKYQQP